MKYLLGFSVALSFLFSASYKIICTNNAISMSFDYSSGILSPVITDFIFSLFFLCGGIFGAGSFFSLKTDNKKIWVEYAKDSLGFTSLGLALGSFVSIIIIFINKSI